MIKDEFTKKIHESKNPIHEMYKDPVMTLRFFGPEWAKNVMDLAPIMERETEDQKKIFSTVMDITAMFRDMCGAIPDENGNVDHEIGI